MRHDDRDESLSPNYGRDFAPVWDAHWSFWDAQVWPFLARVVSERVPGARDWLDLCCGTGSLLRFVCARHIAAVGLDLSFHQLAQARRNAAEAALVCADVRDFALARRFDVVTCMFDSLNYLIAKRDLQRALRNAERHLSERGVFVFDVLTERGFTNVWREVFTIDEPARTIVVQSSFDGPRSLGRCRITGFVRESEHYRRFEEEHVERVYPARTIEGFLKSAGLDFETYDAYELTNPRKETERLLYVCRRR